MLRPSRADYPAGYTAVLVPTLTRDAAIILNGDDTRKLQPGSDSRIILSKNLPVSMGPGDFCYVRLTTEKNNMAWSSPFWA